MESPETASCTESIKETPELKSHDSKPNLEKSALLESSESSLENPLNEHANLQPPNNETDTTIEQSISDTTVDECLPNTETDSNKQVASSSTVSEDNANNDSQSGVTNVENIPMEVDCETQEMPITPMEVNNETRDTQKGIVGSDNADNGTDISSFLGKPDSEKTKDVSNLVSYDEVDNSQSKESATSLDKEKIDKSDATSLQRFSIKSTDVQQKDLQNVEQDNLEIENKNENLISKTIATSAAIEETDTADSQEATPDVEEIAETSNVTTADNRDTVEVEDKRCSENKKDDNKSKNQDSKSVAQNGLQESINQENLNTATNESNESNENPVFVHVTENEKDCEKIVAETEQQDIQEDDEFQKSQPQEDPIPSDDFAPMQLDEEETENNVDEEQGASEEMCIIPDTERVLSQAEKEAAASMVPLRDPAEVTTDKASGGDSSSASKAATEKYFISACIDENVNPCVECCLSRKSNYTVLYDGTNQKFICDDKCLTAFKEKHGSKVVLNSEGDLRVKDLTSNLDNDNMVAKVKFHRRCMECNKKITNDECNLSWETMEFCNEFCLSKYQKRIGSNCANCNAEVRSHCLGKYCVRFGYDTRQFCSSLCLEEYKKGLKVCSYCQKDMSGGGDGFLAPVGDRGQFKDFCSQRCMEKYDIMSNNREQPVVKPGSTCSVCLNEKPITVEFEHDSKANLFCSEPCFVAFKFVNNITPGKCDMCRKYFDNKILEENSMFYDNAQHSFCSKSCQNIYIIAHRKIVPCSWCKVKKYNFDMIKRTASTGTSVTMCSLNCLSLYQVSVNAVHSKKTSCDHCHKNLQALYHLTMSDATIRNFCSYSCVMTFQNQFTKAPITLEPDESRNAPVPTGVPKRTRRSGKNDTSAVPAEVPTIPVISSVQSLATTNGPSSNTRTTRSKNASTDNMNKMTNSVQTVQTITKTQIKHHIVLKPPAPTAQRNVATMCKPITANKGTHTKVPTATKEVQTDEEPSKTAIIPIPVPIYVPSPVWMYSMPFPVPFPFPLPVPVPIFIPTTRNSANGIMKEIKKIQVKIPTDPFEAELLMMAEMVAGDKKEENTDSESEQDDPGPAPDEGTFSPEPVDASNTFGDDMLQMALKMASELDEPAVDLEGALTASTITAQQGSENAVTNEETPEEAPPVHHMIERQTTRGRKRQGRPPKGGASKRGRRTSNQLEIPMMAPPQPAPPPEPIEKPDANMCLKYTFGVNAWKQWVTTKNAELEKSSRRVKLFKPEILQLTADELNYSLCLFVKEVRKPNGQEYAPDTIYYLCLGIQQYLFENGRIDNIFCDAYYEKFTDCLDEVAKKFSVLYNDSHYIVTRVEEEHLWESKQLGAHSPHVLLSTLMFFNTKHFNLTTVDEHMQLSFSHIMKHWKRNPNQPGANKVAGSRNVLLRFYPPQTNTDPNNRKKKVYEQQENEDNPLRCPVKLYEFYLSKCPESVKTRNDVFYLLPERSCVPDSPVWYSTMPLPRNALEKMLHRVKMVKEINVALLTS